MSPSSKSPGSISPLSTTPSLDLPVDPGPPPETAQDYDDIYVEDITPNSPAMPEKNVYDRKGKGKARQRSLIRTPRSAPLIEEDPDDLDVMAKQAYLSPPLTASDSFLLGMHNISLALRKGLSSMDFEVDLDLQSGSERSSSPGGRGPSPMTSDEDEGDLEVGAAFVETAVSELSLEDANESSILTSSGPSEAESSRKATVGDTTIQDAGSVLPSVRFPSIFTQDMDYSSLESSRTASPLLAVSGSINPEDADRTRRRNEGEVTKESGVEILVHRRENNVEMVKRRRRRRIWRQRRLKIQEKGLCELIMFTIRQVVLDQGCLFPARDFLLVITLCFGMACAGILIVRPTLMALYGYDTLGGRLDLDFD